MNRSFKILISVAIIVIGGVLLMRSSGAGTQFLWDISKQGTWLLPLVSVAALIDSINPCAFSILLLTVAFLFSMGQARSGILRIGGTYILGIFVAYLAIGLGIIQALHIFNTPHFMAKVGAAVMILWGGLELINAWFPAFPIHLRIPHAAHGAMAKLMNQASLPAAFGLGALVGICEFPCTGGPYLMVLGLLHDASTHVRGIGYLIWYNLVFISPLVLILGITSNQSLLERINVWKKEHTNQMRIWGGVLMVAFGVLLFVF